MDAARRQVQVALGLLAYFLSAIVALHLLNWQHLPRHMSNFIFLPWRPLWDTGCLALGFGLLLLGHALPRLHPASRDIRLGLHALQAAGVSIAAMVPFASDPTALPITGQGLFHDLAAIFGMGFQAIAMFILVDGARRDKAWQPIVGTSFSWPVVAMALGFIWGFGDLTNYWPAAAVVQRLVAITMVGWVMVVGRRALRWTQPMATASATRGDATP